MRTAVEVFVDDTYMYFFFRWHSQPQQSRFPVAWCIETRRKEAEAVGGSQWWRRRRRPRIGRLFYYFPARFIHSFRDCRRRHRSCCVVHKEYFKFEWTVILNTLFLSLYVMICCCCCCICKFCNCPLSISRTALLSLCVVSFLLIHCNSYIVRCRPWPDAGCSPNASLFTFCVSQLYTLWWMCYHE